MESQICAKFWDGEEEEQLRTLGSKPCVTGRPCSVCKVEIWEVKCQENSKQADTGNGIVEGNICLIVK